MIWNFTPNLHTNSHFKKWAEKWTIMQEAKSLKWDFVQADNQSDLAVSDEFCMLWKYRVLKLLCYVLSFLMMIVG